MDTAEHVLKKYWRDLWPPKPTSLLKNGVGIGTGINYRTLPERLRKVANTFERLERISKIIEDACKKTGTGLPF